VGCIQVNFPLRKIEGDFTCPGSFCQGTQRMKQQRMMSNDQVRVACCRLVSNFGSRVKRKKNVGDLWLCPTDLYSAVVALPRCCGWNPFFQKVLKVSECHWVWCQKKVPLVGRDVKSVLSLVSDLQKLGGVNLIHLWKFFFYSTHSFDNGFCR
jgi:hypothetical protein